jgi:hypothetical protein
MHFQIGHEPNLSRMNLKPKPSPAVLDRLQASATCTHNTGFTFILIPAYPFPQITSQFGELSGEQCIQSESRQA